MTNPELGTSVQNLRKIYEPCVVGRKLKVNNSNHSATNVFYHLMFTLTVITVVVIFATIVEHRSMLNIYWKTFLNVKQEILNKMILKENTVLSFLKYRNNGEKAYSIITFLNVAVYLAWNVTKWNSTMLKYFIINGDTPTSVWSLLFSAFSHNSLLSLTANAIYLYYPLCKLKSISAVFAYVALGFPNRKLLTMSITVRDELNVSVTAFECNAIDNQALLCLFFLIILIVFVLKLSWINSISIISGCIFGIFWYKLGSKIIWDNRKYLTHLLENN